MKLIETNIVIRGSSSGVERIKQQLGKPVEVFNNYGLGLASEPVFSLWNIVRPDKEDYNNYFNLNSSKSWFAWNLSNWGTLHDCMNFDYGDRLSSLYYEGLEELHYRILTPAKKPILALQTLSFYNKDVKISWL